MINVEKKSNKKNLDEKKINIEKNGKKIRKNSSSKKISTKKILLLQNLILTKKNSKQNFSK